MATLTIDGTEIYYERRGAGEPMLLIQGLGGNSLHWGDAFLDGLAQTHELVLYDHRGAGRSGPIDVECTIKGLAEDAVALLDALEIESAHVLGISMGGMVAQELVLSRPERVRTLTLGCSFAGGVQARMTDQAIVGQIAEAVLSGDTERATRVGYEIMIAPEYAADPANYEIYAATAGQYPASVATLMGQLSAIIAHDASERLASIATPTLVIHGTADRLLESVNGELLARLIPDARLELLEGSGHMFFWEQPERSAKLVIDHVAAATPGS